MAVEEALLMVDLDATTTEVDGVHERRREGVRQGSPVRRCGDGAFSTAYNHQPGPGADVAARSGSAIRTENQCPIFWPIAVGPPSVLSTGPASDPGAVSPPLFRRRPRSIHRPCRLLPPARQIRLGPRRGPCALPAPTPCSAQSAPSPGARRTLPPLPLHPRAVCSVAGVCRAPDANVNPPGPGSSGPPQQRK